MSQQLRVALLLLILLISGWLVLHFIVPAFGNLFAGLGIEIPPPLSKVVIRFPRAALVTLFVGPPILLFALVAAALRVLRHAH